MLMTIHVRQQSLIVLHFFSLTLLQRDKAPIDALEARRQHAALVAAVRGLGLDVLELPPDESNAASVFTQDLAVVVNGIALMCRPSTAKEAGTTSNGIRQVEVDTMRAVLKKELNQSIVDPRWSSTALLSGSDVLFTGREFFVGLSNHTNMEGAVAVASTWPEYPCTPIKVSDPAIADRSRAAYHWHPCPFQIDGPFHLKYFLCMAGPDVMFVGSTGAAQVVLKRVEREASHRYQTLTLPEDGAANCLFVNGTLFHRTKEETPKCEAVSLSSPCCVRCNKISLLLQVFSAKVDYPRTAQAMSEFAKAQPPRPLSSLFLLLRKSKHVRRL
jgi:dimethylargininase